MNVLWVALGTVEKPISLRAFGDMLTERGFGRRKDSMRRKARCGIALRTITG